MQESNELSRNKLTTPRDALEEGIAVLHEAFDQAVSDQ
jgi:hypothetical protein